MSKLVYLVQDLLFVSKIRETARQLGVDAQAFRDPASLAEAAKSAEMVILDLRRPDALSTLDLLAPLAIETFGFIDHERVDVMEAAREKGCRAYAKGKFSTELPNLLSRLTPTI
jgi:hypothetical protein